MFYLEIVYRQVTYYMYIFLFRNHFKYMKGSWFLFVLINCTIELSLLFYFCSGFTMEELATHTTPNTGWTKLFKRIMVIFFYILVLSTYVNHMKPLLLLICIHKNMHAFLSLFCVIYSYVNGLVTIDFLINIG